MFEILSTVALTVSASIVVGFLSVTLARATSARADGSGALGAWFVLVLAFGATGALGPCGGSASRRSASRSCCPSQRSFRAYFALPSVRNAMATTPLPALVAVHAIRVLGVIFLVLYAEGRLPAPFAPSAGWGDVLIGATALPLAWAVTRFGRRVRPLVFLWNAVGVADLLAAVALGTLSAPGPLQVFVGPPDERHHDQLALAHHPRISGADPVFHSHRHLRSAARQVPSLRAGVCVARRWRPTEVGLKRRRRSLCPGVGSRFWGRQAGLMAAASKRRRATLPASAPPPIPSGVDSVTPWGTGQRRSGRRRRSECAS